MNTDDRTARRVRHPFALAMFTAGALWLTFSCSGVSKNSDGAGVAGSTAHAAGAAGTPMVSLGGSTASAGTSSGGVATAGAITGGAPNGGMPSGGMTTAGAMNGGASGAAMGRGGSAGSAGGVSFAGGSAAAAGAGGSAAAAGAGGAGGSSSGTRSAGCGKGSTVTFGQVPGESGQNVGTGAGGYVKIGSRGFALRLPDNYDNNQPYRLFFGFHWNGGSAKEVDTGGSNGYNMAHFGLQKLSKNGAIFVAPDGLNAGWANSGGQDLKFVDDMLKLIEDNYCVDTSHVFTNGFSYGGGMSYEIACARAKVFRGAAIYEGAQLSGCDGGNDPIALWQMVGLTDTTCPMNLATPIRDRFVKNNGCTVQNPPQPAQPPPYSSTAGHICTDYAGCSSGHPLRWCVHQAGHGNAVVDGTADLYNSCATPPKSCSSSCPCTWVPDDVWKFFSAL